MPVSTMHEIQLEPIGEVIGCGPDETILDAALRQGFNLVYGCREGQCSACKSYLLEGQVSLRRHSSFALSETEEEQGYTLLCRAMPDSDVAVELLHVDLDDYKLTSEIVTATAEVSRVEQVTRDMYLLALDGPQARGLAFTPGQYLDVRVPGTELRRSFSVAGLPGEPIELIVKHYPGGRFSGLLAGGAITRGQVIEFTGPYGSLRLRGSGRPAVMIAGGSGIAPMLGLLRHLAQAASGGRPVRAFYGARQVQDLFGAERMGLLADVMPDCRFCPVLSECDDPGWTGERGLVHEAAARLVSAEGITAPDLYLCGPPPMVEAAIELFSARFDVPGQQIFYDKFTTAADGASVGST
jgi:propane monooxygenase reductase subunit